MRCGADLRIVLDGDDGLRVCCLHESCKAVFRVARDGTITLRGGHPGAKLYAAGFVGPAFATTSVVDIPARWWAA